MKSKKLIGIIAVLALIAVVFAGSAAAVTTTDNAIYKTTDVNDNQMVKLMDTSDNTRIRLAELTAMRPIIHFDSANQAMLTNLGTNRFYVNNLMALNTMDNSNWATLTNMRAMPFIILPATVSELNSLSTNALGSYYLAGLNRYSDVNSAMLNADTNSTRANLNSSFYILPATVANLNSLTTNQYAVNNLNRYSDVNLANLNTNALGAIVVGLNNLDTNALGSYYLADLSRYSDVNSATLNTMDTNTNQAMLNTNALGAIVVGLNNLGTNALGSYYLADLSRYSDVNAANLNTMDTNTNQAMLNSTFLILPVSVANLNSLSTNQYAVNNLNRYSDVNSFAVSVADLSRFALNTGNMSELMSFLSRLNAETNTNNANSSLLADINALNTNLNTTANLNAETNTNTNKNTLSEASGALNYSGEWGRFNGSDAAADTNTNHLSEASGTSYFNYSKADTYGKADTIPTYSIPTDTIPTHTSWI